MTKKLLLMPLAVSIVLLAVLSWRVGRGAAQVTSEGAEPGVRAVSTDAAALPALAPSTPPVTPDDDEPLTSPTSSPTPSSSPTRDAAHSWDCVDYDVVDQVVVSVGQLDVDRTMHSLQLNPDCLPVAEDFDQRVRGQLLAFVERDRHTHLQLQVDLHQELATAAAEGRIPTLQQRDLYPETFERVEERCHRIWMSRTDAGNDHAWSADADYQTFWKNTICNELQRNTPHRLRIDIGRTGRTHVATYADCPKYIAAMMRGDREKLEMEVMLFLTLEFTSQGLLDDARTQALLARFERVQDRAMQAKVAFLR